jgi:DNA-binding response OmpR family regulator
MSVRPILVYGQFRREDLSHIGQAAAEAGKLVTRSESIEQALAWLDENEAHALLCHANDAELLAVQTRSRAKLSKLPVLALSESLRDLDFVAAFSWGADDLLPMDALRPLITRLRALPKEAPPPPVEHRGEALVAETDQTRRTTVARVLRNAGFTLRFAVSVQDARDFALDPKLKLVVSSTELMPDAAGVVQAARSSGSPASFILGAAPRDLKSERAKIQGLAGVLVTDSFAAPENVLFVANELTGGRTSGRASPRIAYGTKVDFRVAGRETDERGFSYNVSEKGIYVRTLSPPDEDEVWLELCPPRVERLVRLVGRVAWRRPFNFNESATVPPGFGVEIVDGSVRDRALWVEGYLGLGQAVG